MNIKIYGKDDCSFCTKAVDLLKSYNVSYSYYKVGVDLTVDELIEQFPLAKTVPIVVINEQWVGGYDKLATYLEETMSDYGHPI